MSPTQLYITPPSLGGINHSLGVFPYSELPDSLKDNEKSLYLKGKFADKIGKIMVMKKNTGNNSVASSGIDNADMPIRFRTEGQNLLIHDMMSGTPESVVRRELSRILDDMDIQTIRFDPYLDTGKKRILANILAKNHPLIEVLRLIPGNDVVNVSFAGIKKLNDIYGQSFVDALLLSSKRRIIQSLETWGPSPDHIRIVRDDYKNLSISLPPDSDIFSLLFHATPLKEVFLEEILCDMEPIIESLAKGKNIEAVQVRNDILRNWNFWVGKSRVGVGADNIQKLHAFAQAELVSRDGIDRKDIAVQTFDVARSLQIAKEAVRQETGIIKKWEGRDFVSEQIAYPIIVHVDGHAFIHPELLRQVRKHSNEVKIEPEELSGEIRNYIDTLNAGFDFITPTHDLEKDLLKAEKMSEDFWSGIIEKESVLTNFKGVATKENFMHMIDNKTWIRMFIDIKDMGIQNLQSFQYLSRKIATWETSPDDLLSGWKEVTDIFMILIAKIRESHPGVQIALWWDEVYLFFPWASGKETSILLQSIHEKLQVSRLGGRIGYSLESQDSEKIFKRLDESTVLHKMIETMLDRKRMMLYGRQKMGHETISLEIWKGMDQSEISTLLAYPSLQKELDNLLQLIAAGMPITSEKIPLPIGKWQLLFRHNDGILHFIFTKTS